VCHVPDGAHPSFAMGYSDRDNAFYRAWDDIAKSRDVFTEWINRHILSTADFAEYLRSIGRERDGAHV
jgi:glutaconate CoA-transferase, subunit A